MNVQIATAQQITGPGPPTKQQSIFVLSRWCGRENIKNTTAAQVVEGFIALKTGLSTYHVSN